MSMTNLFGQLLDQYQKQRTVARKEAIDALYARHGINKSDPGYRLAETKPVFIKGKEVIEYRLYKLVDAAVTEVAMDVTKQTHEGLESLRENRGDKT